MADWCGIRSNPFRYVPWDAVPQLCVGQLLLAGFVCHLHVSEQTSGVRDRGENKVMLVRRREGGKGAKERIEVGADECRRGDDGPCVLKSQR